MYKISKYNVKVFFIDLTIKPIILKYNFPILLNYLRKYNFGKYDSFDKNVLYFILSR